MNDVGISTSIVASPCQVRPEWRAALAKNRLQWRFCVTYATIVVDHWAHWWPLQNTWSFPTVSWLTSGSEVMAQDCFCLACSNGFQQHFSQHSDALSLAGPGTSNEYADTVPSSGTSRAPMSCGDEFDDRRRSREHFVVSKLEGRLPVLQWKKSPNDIRIQGQVKWDRCPLSQTEKIWHILAKSLKYDHAIPFD